MNKAPVVNLGQSLFQDTFFVVGSQTTPFRTLRQIELEIRELEESIKQAEFTLRRQELKISKLDPKDPEQAIDLEEAEWARSRQMKLIEEAMLRKSNFESLREATISSATQEYWDAGFEADEINHWTSYCAKQLSFSKILGQLPPPQVLEILTQLPEESQIKAIQLSNFKAQQLALTDQKAQQPVLKFEDNPNHG